MKNIRRITIVILLASLMLLSLFNFVVGFIDDPIKFLERSGNTIVLVAIVVIFGLLWGRDGKDVKGL